MTSAALPLWPKGKPIPALNAPLVTNASLNRDAAAKCLAAGMTAAEIAREWPAVWRPNAAGQLAQKYDYEINDGSGRFETNRRITDESVERAMDRPRPTQAHLDALREFVAAHGRLWKSELREAWMTGVYPASADSMNLQQVRNNCGPSWLVRFGLKGTK